MERLPRRKIIYAAGSGLVGAFAGCSSLQTDSKPSDTDEQTFERLDTTAVYVADGIEFTVPPEVETVSRPQDALLLVLPGDTNADTGQAVEWLTDDRTLALWGADAEATWLTWMKSHEFADAFENEGYLDSEGDPRLVVGGTVGQWVIPYRHQWESEPSDRDVFRTLDGSLVDLQNETPPGRGGAFTLRR